MSADWDASPWSCGGPVKVPKAIPAEDKQDKKQQEGREDAVPSYVVPPRRHPKHAAKRVKPHKWRAAFDGEGRPVGFSKLLKPIAHGGVDHSIRAEVWEFLLGCYSLGTTAEYRQELRQLRRERYQKLIEQCQQMHASIGTGTLAYTVGTKVLDVRIMSKDTARKEARRVNLELKAKSEAAREEEISDDKFESRQLDTSSDFECSFRNVSVGFDAVYKPPGPSPEADGVVESRIEDRAEELFASPQSDGAPEAKNGCPEELFASPPSDGAPEAKIGCAEELFASPPSDGAPEAKIDCAEELFASPQNGGAPEAKIGCAEEELFASPQNDGAPEAKIGCAEEELFASPQNDGAPEAKIGCAEEELFASPQNDGVLDAKIDCIEEFFASPSGTVFEDADLDENGMEEAPAIDVRDPPSGGVNSSECSVCTDSVKREIAGDTPKPVESQKPKRLFSADAGPLSWSAGSLKRIKSRLVRDKRKKDRGRIGDRLAAADAHTPLYRKHSDARIGLNGASVSGDLHEPVVALGKNASEERRAEWLWILHRIVVDVVRTDRHLEFYGDAKNMARMSDILAVYAWIDPDTGYCQGMSDLLSPFIVLFEDDADAFWCFESLVRRVRQNFQMEGPVGVMKQLQALSKILEVTDPQMSKHFAIIGADNFLFAFRMLLVLFRRELPFGESLVMWEMMWAADFNQTMAWALEFHCLDALVLRLPSAVFHLEPGRADDSSYSAPPSMSFSLSQPGCSPMRDFSTETAITTSTHFGASPFCGLRPGALLMRHPQRMLPSVSTFLGKNGDEELSVFCVAAILVQNRSRLLKEIQSLDDAIKVFNDMNFIIRVNSCIHTAKKLRKKYRSRLAKHIILERWNTISY